MHAFVSQAGGGFLWKDNSADFRITRYRMHHYPIDTPGFYVYLRMADGTVWSPDFRPFGSKPDKWEAAHRPGSTSFYAEKDGLTAVLDLYMSQETDTLIWRLSLKNCLDKPNENAEIKCDVFAYAELSQMEWKEEQFGGYYWRHMLKARYDREIGAVLYLCHSSIHHTKEGIPLVYFAQDAETESWCCDRDNFAGNYRSEQNPAAVEQGFCDNSDLPHGEPCAALQSTVYLRPGDESVSHFFLGGCGRALVDYEGAYGQAKDDIAKLRTPGEPARQFALLNSWWKEHLELFGCDLPDAAAQNQINTWSPVNSVNTFRYSRSVNTLAPGLRGIGFRDSCQDSQAMAYRKPEEAKKLLRILLPKQCEDGHASHTVPSNKKELPEAKICCDDHLWLPFAVYAIAAETGDDGFLDEEIPFLAADRLSGGPSASVWEHLMRGIRFTNSHLGRYGLPLTLGGDWNDIINKFTPEQKGESVFAAMQYAAAMRRLLELAEYTGRTGDAAFLRDEIARQEGAVNKCAFKGEWWGRCTDDGGNWIGTPQTRGGELWLNPQSWAVISGSGSVEQRRAGMERVHERLNTGYGLRLLIPGYETWPDANDPFTGYNPGCGENGAVFCHSNTWAIIAEAMLGHGARAWEYFLQIMPHNALQKLGLARYKAEPYAWASNIVGPESKKYGWANVMHVTGTAAWMDVAATQYLLGVRPTVAGLVIDPCVPPDWDGFSVKRVYRGTSLDIQVENPAHVERGVKEMYVNGARIDVRGVPMVAADMLRDGKAADVRVVMG